MSNTDLAILLLFGLAAAQGFAMLILAGLIRKLVQLVKELAEEKS